MNKRCLVIVIVEDAPHKMLIYRYLMQRRMGPIRIELSPSGKGSAENWVRRAFVKEISEYRRRQAQTKLIVVIDADTGTVENRLRQLDQALKDGGKEPVHPASEQIARLVPRRNIETWILCLNEQEVNEETDYKRTRENWNELIPQAAETLFQWTRSQTEPPNHCVDSLRSGVRELRRLTL